jgi:hypothetical protein
LTSSGELLREGSVFGSAEESQAAEIGKRMRRIVNIAGVTSILVGTVIRADAGDDGYIVSVIWDPQERLFGDRFSKDEYEKLLVELT